MAFGISGAEGRSQMVYGDVVVAFYDRKELRFRAEDYYISHLSQCDGSKGVCPDERIGAKNDAILSEILRFKENQIQLFSMIYLTLSLCCSGGRPKERRDIGEISSTFADK